MNGLGLPSLHALDQSTPLHTWLCTGTSGGTDIPIENKRAFLDVSADIVEHVGPVFYGEPKTAAFKAIGLT